MKRIPRGIVLRLAAVLLLAAPLRGAAEDTVLWSDGRTWSGTIRLGGDGRLPLHDGTRLRPVPLETVARIDWRVATQRMERAWAFREAGQTAKRYEGDPYPVRHWKAQVTLRNGETIPGHLPATVFFLEDAEGVSRLVVKSKQRGRPGETPDDLVSPVALQFASRAGDADLPPRAARHLRVDAAPEGLQFAAASLDPTVTATVVQEAPGLFRFTVEGGRPVLALRAGLRIRVGWPAAEDPGQDAALRRRVETALPKVRDFFDDLRLLGVLRDPSDPARGHSLLLLLRQGRTTLGGDRPNPWHVEVWTWRLGAEDDRLLFEGRAVLARDRRAPDGPEPEVALDPRLAALAASGDAELRIAWPAGD